MALIEHSAVQVGLTGILGDRRYALIDPHDRLVNGKRIGPLATIVAGVKEGPEALALHFPDGSVVDEVEGSFSQVLSEWAGQPLRLVRLDDEGGGIDRTPDGGGFSIVSSGSLLAL